MSRPPDVLTPIAFAFRMRLLFGVGSRAEVIRYLITSSAPDESVQEVADAVVYAKRNVSDTLAALANAGLVTSHMRRNEHRYSIDRTTWERFLGLEPDTWPTYRDWPHILRGLRRLRRWIDDPRLDDVTPYMLPSRARDVMANIEGDLDHAGVDVTVPAGGLPGERYWEWFRGAIERALSCLEAEPLR